MFFLRTAPLALTEARIRGLRLSLNTPVVATEELPIGPARGAILTHDEADGAPRVTIGIRSLRAERVALYSFEGDLAEASLEAAVDGALSFAESMGFLFDEDEMGAGGVLSRVRCLGLWRELLGEAPALAAVEEAAAEPAELLLEELAEDDAPPSELGAGADAFDPGGAAFEPPDETLVMEDADPGFAPQFEGDVGGGAGFELEGGLDPHTLAIDEGGAAPLEEDAALPLELSGFDAEAAPAPARDRGPALSKFRGREAPQRAARVAGRAGASAPDARPAEGAEPLEEGRPAAPLGRLRLVRRKRGSEKGRFLWRLLGAY